MDTGAIDLTVADYVRMWGQPQTVWGLEQWVKWADRQPTPLLRAFWLALGYRQRFTRARCLHMVRERWGTALRVGM